MHFELNTSNNIIMKSLAAALASFVSIAPLAFAHTTGHTTEGAQTVHHMLTSTDHLLMIGVVVAILGVFVVKQLRARKN